MKYLTVKGTSSGEITEKKSRFIGQIFSVKTDEEAKGIIQRIKKDHHQARHSCSAYRLRTVPMTERYNDDGEPGGTAGMPILEVLRGQALEDTMIVVTRYFGGTKLGTGGLVRAYTQAAQAALEDAAIVEVGRFIPIDIVVDYTLSGKIDYWINSEKILHEETDYGSDVTYHIFVPEEEKDQVTAFLTEQTNGNCLLSSGDVRDGYIEKGKLIYETTEDLG